MNTRNTRNLIASVTLATLASLGLIALARFSGEVAASVGVVASLAILGLMELRGASRRLPRRQPGNAIELYRSVNSEA